ncbi:MAG: DUF721 domain-containing protein [Paracoccaceae bacterium]
MPSRQSTTKGFKQTSRLMGSNIRKAAESRGFAVSRLLTHWDEIAGPKLAAMARPVEITYGRGGFGATLVVLTTGPQAPMLEMEKDGLRERVNTAYGYNAISRIRITQTAASGFAEAQAHFAGAPAKQPKAEDPATRQRATHLAQEVTDDTLRTALERLGRNVLTKHKSK